MAGVATTALVPTARHLSWTRNEYIRPGFMDPFEGTSSDRPRWKNWSGIQSAFPKSFEVPSDTSSVVDIMARAQGLVRPVGSGHSFTPLVNSDGIIIDISRLSGIVSHDQDTQTVTIGAGTRIGRAARMLDKLGLGFPNLPDIDTQTLAGSYSTATHGTGISLPAMHADIIGFQLVTAGGEVKDVKLGRDDNLLKAGQVSLGALGIITQYTLKLVPSYKLRRRVVIEKIETILDQAEALAKQHRNFEFYYAPHTGYGINIFHDITDDPETEQPNSQDDNTLSDLRLLRDQFGWSKWMRRRISSVAFPKNEIENYVGKSWKLLATARPTRFNESEYHLPAENGIQAVRETIKMLEHRRDTYFPIEVRFVRGDDAWLSPFWHGDDISIAVHASHDELYDYLLDEFEPMFRRYGGRPHWGKLHTLNKNALEQLYPRLADFRAIQRDLDPSGKMLNGHLKTLLGR